MLKKIATSVEDFESEISRLPDTIRLDPGNAQAYSCRGLAYPIVGRYVEAIADYSAALEHDPGNVWLLTSRVIAYACNREYGRATIDCDEAIWLYPKFYLPYHIRGRVHQILGYSDKAAFDLDAAARLAPASANFQGNRITGNS